MHSAERTIHYLFRTPCLHVQLFVCVKHDCLYYSKTCHFLFDCGGCTLAQRVALRRPVHLMKDFSRLIPLSSEPPVALTPTPRSDADGAVYSPAPSSVPAPADRAAASPTHYLDSGSKHLPRHQRLSLAPVKAGIG